MYTEANGQTACSGISDYFFCLGFLLILFPATVLIGSSFLLLSGTVTSGLTIPFALVVTAVFLILFGMSFNWKIIQAAVPALLFVLIISGSILITGSIFDKSWDGQAYHQEAVIQLASGWNPYYDDLNSDLVAHEKWLTHYAKGPWLIASSLYLFTERIEYSKAFGLIFIIASWCLIVSVLIKEENFSQKQTYLLSALAALNPVSIYQSLTFLVDGQLASLLLSLLAAAFLFTKRNDWYSILLSASICILLVNVKFTAIPFVFIILFFFLLYTFIFREPKNIKKIIYYFLPSLCLGVLVIGFNPYVKNTVENGHPFYPLMGEGKEDIMEPTKPRNLREMNRYSSLFYSLFSESKNNTKTTKLKFPFTIKIKELYCFSDSDVRVAGFGPLFSAALMMSILILCSYYLMRPIFPFLFVVLAIIISVLIHPESWWARYAPQLWLIPVITSIACMKSERKQLRIYGLGIVFILILNISLVSLVHFTANLLNTYQVAKEFNILKDSRKRISIYFGPFEATRVRLQEADISYYQVERPSLLPCNNSQLLAGGIRSVKFCH